MGETMKKDWVGNGNSIYKTLGASNHTDDEREQNDYYATDPIAIDLLLQEETFNKNIWECACGEGYMSERLKDNGFDVYSADLIDRGYQDELLDFLNSDVSFNGDIITNPPYKYAQNFIEKSLDSINEGNKVAMFLKLTFLESKKKEKNYLRNILLKRYMYLAAEYRALRMVTSINTHLRPLLMVGMYGKRVLLVSRLLNG